MERAVEWRRKRAVIKSREAAATKRRVPPRQSLPRRPHRHLHRHQQRLPLHPRHPHRPRLPRRSIAPPPSVEWRARVGCCCRCKCSSNPRTPITRFGTIGANCKRWDARSVLGAAVNDADAAYVSFLHQQMMMRVDLVADICVSSKPKKHQNSSRENRPYFNCVKYCFRGD